MTVQRRKQRPPSLDGFRARLRQMDNALGRHGIRDNHGKWEAHLEALLWEWRTLDRPAVVLTPGHVGCPEHEDATIQEITSADDVRDVTGYDPALGDEGGAVIIDGHVYDSWDEGGHSALWCRDGGHWLSLPDDVGFEYE